MIRNCRHSVTFRARDDSVDRCSWAFVDARLPCARGADRIWDDAGVAQSGAGAGLRILRVRLRTRRADCRPVRARVEDDGNWSVWIPEFRRWVPVPAFAVGEPDRFGDGRSHVCSTKPLPTLPVFHIFCFSPTGSKS